MTIRALINDIFVGNCVKTETFILKRMRDFLARLINIAIVFIVMSVCSFNRAISHELYFAARIIVEFSDNRLRFIRSKKMVLVLAVFSVLLVAMWYLTGDAFNLVLALLIVGGTLVMAALLFGARVVAESIAPPPIPREIASIFLNALEQSPRRIINSPFKPPLFVSSFSLNK